MSFKFLRTAAALATLGACTQLALAADGGPEFRFSGFGTVGAVHSDSDIAQFRSSMRQDAGAMGSDLDWGVDSNLGLQLDAKFNDTFSGVAQLLTNRAADGFEPRVEWLFGQAKVADWANVRAGRMVLPTFMVSDSRNVGYASHWLRAPVDIYAYYIPTSFDGVQGVLHGNLAGTNFTAQLSTGQAKSDYVVFRSGKATTLSADYNQLNSINLLAENGDWTLRFGTTRADDGKLKDNFTGLGLQYDNGQLLVMAEMVKRKQKNYDGSAVNIQDSKAQYVSAGYRFGAFMPYVTLSSIKPNSTPTSFIMSPTTGKSKALGLRWDAMKNVAVKFQVEESKGNSSITMLPTSGTFFANPALNKVRLISSSVSFVF